MAKARPAMGGGLPTTYVRVDLGALRHNYEEIVAFLNGRARLMPVVKANAYGHGLVEVARLFAQLGCPALGVAAVEEGLRLREARVLVPITVFQPPTRDELPAAIESKLTVTLTQEEHVEAVAGWARDCRYEIAVDVGLGRSGHEGDPVAFYRWAGERIGSPAAGIWSHLGPGMIPPVLPKGVPRPWAEAGSVAERLRHLEALRETLYAGPEPRPVFHVSSSAVLCETEALLWDQVRVGSLLYGAYPVRPSRRPFDLRGTIELRTHIVELRTIPPGRRIGYGGEFRTRRPTRLATLPVGLSHGVGVVPESVVSPAAAAKRALALAAGRWGGTFRSSLARVGTEYAPLVGRPSLNECTVDVTEVSGVKLGDEVAAPARMTTLGAGIPRVYVEGG